VSAEDPTYYEVPILKEPVWIWAVPAYFWGGGAGGAASVLGLVARATRRPGLKRLARRCEVIAVAGGVSGTALLVHDLGRPERFLNMLRVFRPTSPMSVGSWTLAAYAPAATVALAGGPLGTAGAVGAGVLGVPLAGYTGVLLANTVVPVWAETGPTIPALFIASGVTAAASLLDLLDLDTAEARVVRRYGVIGKLIELLAAEAMQRDADRVERVGRPLHEGPSGALWRAAKVLTGASLLLSLLPRSTRRRRVTAGVLGAAGSMAVKFAVMEAGKASARDPRATFQVQRDK